MSVQLVFICLNYFIGWKFTFGGKKFDPELVEFLITNVLLLMYNKQDKVCDREKYF